MNIFEGIERQICVKENLYAFICTIALQLWTLSIGRRGWCVNEMQMTATEWTRQRKKVHRNWKRDESVRADGKMLVHTQPLLLIATRFNVCFIRLLLRRFFLLDFHLAKWCFNIHIINWTALRYPQRRYSIWWLLITRFKFFQSVMYLSVVNNQCENQTKVLATRLALITPNDHSVIINSIHNYISFWKWTMRMHVAEIFFHPTANLCETNYKSSSVEIAHDTPFEWFAANLRNP